MKKFKLNAVAAIAASLASAGAFAAVDIDLTTPAPVLVAKEIVASSGSPVTLTNLANALDIVSKVGYALSNGEVRYVRVELANGVFNSATATIANANAAVGAINGIGTSVIYFSITAGTGGIATTDQITVTGNRDITGTASNVTASFSVYDQPSQAQAGGTTGRIVFKDSKSYINFGSSYQLAVNATAELATSDVEASPSFTAFKKDASNTNDTLTARLGTLDYKLATTVPVKADGNAITLANLMATGSSGTKLVVTGDFSAAADSDGTYSATSAKNRVYLSAAADCSTSALAASTVTATSATFNVGATATSANINLCFKPRATVQIPASDYSAALNPVSASASTYAVTALSKGTTGSIVRNGTELQAPLAQTTTGFVSRVFFSNTGTVDATITDIKVLTETGNTVTLGTLTGYVIPAKGALQIPVSDLAKAFTGAPRGALVFTIARPNSQIQGTYQIVNSNGSSVSNHVMVRPSTN